VKLLARILSTARKLAPSTASTLYVVAMAIRAEDGRGLSTWALAVAALYLAIRAPYRTERVRRRTEWGLALVLASLASRDGGPWLDAFGDVGALMATWGAAEAIHALAVAPSLLTPRGAEPRWVRPAVASGWAIAVVASLDGARGGAAARVAEDVAPVAAWAGLLALAAYAWWEGDARRLELGVADRHRTGTSAVFAAVLVAGGAAAFGLVPGERAARIAAAASAITLTRVALHPDAVAMARASRLFLVLAWAGGPAVVLGATAAQDRPSGAATACAITSVLCLGIGALARPLAKQMRPARGAWLDAIEAAHDAVLRSDPEEALREVLVAMRAPAGHTGESPELWTFDPVRVLAIDAAGYAREREAQIPAGLLDVASREPEATLRCEVLEALEVRRPDLRPLLRWLDDRRALLATVVTRGGEAEGILVIPRGDRGEPLSLEEARAMKRLADQLAAVCHARGALARSLLREQRLMERLDEADDRVVRLEHAAAVDAQRHAGAATRLARPATVGVYAASSRLSYDALERRTRAGAPIALVAPSGVDPVPYLARAHLAGARGAGPFVLVDGTSAREHDVERWRDPVGSPLALADGGALVLVDGGALPLDVQRLIARALAEKRPPWERADPLDVVLTITATVPPEELLDAGRLELALASRLGDAFESPIALPRLRDRAEDLRAILTDRLAREGLRVRGYPIGIDDRAFAGLVEHAFPGEDAEVLAMVQRLVAGCRGAVVREADVAALDLAPASSEPAPPPGVRSAG